MPKHRLQLAGVTAMFLASKYEEIEPCKIQEVVEFCGNFIDAEDLFFLEWCMLDTLNFDLNVATVNVFVTRFIQVAHHLFENEERIPFLINYIAQLSLLDYDMLQFNNSQVAISAIVLSLHFFRKTFWNKTLEFYSGYTNQELEECMRKLHRIWKLQPINKANVLWKKFSNSDYMRVASLKPREELPFGFKHLQ